MHNNTFVRDFGPRGTVLRDRAAADRFVELIAQFPDAPMCWRSLQDAGKGALGNWDGTLPDYFDEFQTAQANGYGVYAVVNEGGHRDADITNVRAVFVDADGVPLSDVEWHVEPHFLVYRNETHWHAYWLVYGLTPEQFRGVQKRLADYYGTDSAVSNPSRLMRVPGFQHLKDPDDPQEVILVDYTDGFPGVDIRSDLELSYTEIIEGLPEPQEKACKTRSTVGLRQPSERRGVPVPRDWLLGALRAIPADCKYPVWRNVIWAVRDARIVPDMNDLERLKLLNNWSNGKLQGSEMEKLMEFLTRNGHKVYLGYADVEETFYWATGDAESPVGIGAIYEYAKQNGYRAPPYVGHANGGEDYEEGPDPGSSSRTSHRRSFRPLSEAEQDAQSEPEWLIPGVLQSETLALIYGPENSYKSFLALDLVLSAAADVTWADCIEAGQLTGYRAEKPLTTLFIAGEGSRGIEKLRRPAWRHRHEISGELPFYTVGEMPRFGDEQEIKWLIEDIEAAGVKPDIIVIDTMARAMVGLDENSAKDTGTFVAACDRLKRHFGATVVVIHHTGKDGRKGARGSSNLAACFDTRFRVEGDLTNQTAWITNEKQKDDESWREPIWFQGEAERFDADGKPLSSLVFSRCASKATTPAIQRVRRSEEVDTALSRCGGVAGVVATKVLAEAIVALKMERGDIAATEMDDGDKEKEVKSEMRRLQRQAKAERPGSPGLLTRFLAPNPDGKDLMWSLGVEPDEEVGDN